MEPKTAKGFEETAARLLLLITRQTGYNLSDKLEPLVAAYLLEIYQQGRADEICGI